MDQTLEERRCVMIAATSMLVIHPDWCRFEGVAEYVPVLMDLIGVPNWERARCVILGKRGQNGLPKISARQSVFGISGALECGHCCSGLS